MKDYVAVIKEAIPGITNADLHTPFNASDIHNLDLIILRDSLENYFGFEIPEADWNGLHTLYETLEYCRKKIQAVTKRYTHDSKTSTSRAYEIALPQMANKALSENWLLKELGDMHWELLAKGLEQKVSEFTDKQGNRLYAAFVRVKYAISRLNEFKEGDLLQLNSEVSRNGNHTYYTTVKGTCNEKTIEAHLLTSFSAKAQDGNALITKSNPERKVNHIPEMDATPDFFIGHRLLKKGIAEVIEANGYTFKISDDEIETLVHTINPHYEINGVGLVYFAVYPIIADMCASEFFRNTMEMTDYDARHHTVFRDIFYFANCNADDKIVVKLNSAKLLEHDRIQLTASLYRKSDNKLMARVLTVKQKAGWACNAG